MNSLQIFCVSSRMIELYACTEISKPHTLCSFSTSDCHIYIAGLRMSLPVVCVCVCGGGGGGELP